MSSETPVAFELSPAEVAHQAYLADIDAGRARRPLYTRVLAPAPGPRVPPLRGTIMDYGPGGLALVHVDGDLPTARREFPLGLLRRAPRPTWERGGGR